MKANSLLEMIFEKWPAINHARATDRVYADGIYGEEIQKLWRRWKFGFLGFGGAPIYLKEAQDCDDLARDFIVYIRKKLCSKGKAQPVFYVSDGKHAYISYCNNHGVLSVFDPRDGRYYDPKIKFVEMI